jgi:hypothetical protein
MVCGGLVLLLLTCLFTELLPRFLLPPWILLFVAASLNLGHLLETLFKRLAPVQSSPRAGQAQK